MATLDYKPSTAPSICYSGATALIGIQLLVPAGNNAKVVNTGFVFTSMVDPFIRTASRHVLVANN